MAKLEYTFKNDTLFKMLFTQYPDLLMRLVAELLEIPFESIGQFDIINPDIPPESLGDKFCRLDINMTVDGQRVDLEIQVANEGDYPERSLYYWARDYSTALSAGVEYSELPRTVVISIVDFKLFDCVEFHSEFQTLEVTRHTLLTDRMSLHYFELLKLPELTDRDNKLELWLTLFNAETEEDLQQIEAWEVPIMKQAIGAYHSVSASDDFKEAERLRTLARHNEASALGHARREERARWQTVVADKDAALADQKAEIERLRAQLEASKREDK
jgi:predicted transposase/invertase (TIGR01784 family)